MLKIWTSCSGWNISLKTYRFIMSEAPFWPLKSAWLILQFKEFWLAGLDKLVFSWLFSCLFMDKKTKLMLTVQLAEPMGAESNSRDCCHWWVNVFSPLYIAALLNSGAVVVFQPVPDCGNWGLCLITFSFHSSKLECCPKKLKIKPEK